LTKTIAKTISKALWLPNVPEFVMKLILGEMSYLLFSSKNISAQKISTTGFEFQFPKIEKAISNLYS
jgi:NAD dependent epimerase/dehydratase family enzyme